MLLHYLALADSSSQEKELPVFSQPVLNEGCNTGGRIDSETSWTVHGSILCLQHTGIIRNDICALIQKSRTLDLASRGAFKIKSFDGPAPLIPTPHRKSSVGRRFKAQRMSNGLFWIDDSRQSYSIVPPAPVALSYDCPTKAISDFETVLISPASFDEVFYKTDIDLNCNNKRRRLGLPASPIWPLKGNRIEEGHVPGIHWPYAYEAGPAFGAPFLMHREDLDFYSLNYLYEGEKCWIIIPPDSADLLENKSRESMPDFYSSSCSQVIRHRPTFFPPELLQKWNIPYTAFIQHRGEIVVTLPRAYHQGFSCGYTLAEAVNFTRSCSIPESYKLCKRGKCKSSVLGSEVFPLANCHATDQPPSIPKSHSETRSKKGRSGSKKRKFQDLGQQDDVSLITSGKKPKPRNREDGLIGARGIDQISHRKDESQEIFEQLDRRLPNAPVEEINLLAALYFSIGSPDAFAELQKSFSVARNCQWLREMQYQTVSDILSALDRNDEVATLSAAVRRLLLGKLALKRNELNRKYNIRRARRYGQAEDDSEPDDCQPQKGCHRRLQARTDLMQWAYANLEVSDHTFNARKKQLKERLRASRNWDQLQMVFGYGILVLIPLDGNVLKGWK